MRSLPAAFVLLILSAGACRQTSPAAGPASAPPSAAARTAVAEVPPDPSSLVRALRSGDPEAEGRLAALGEDARRWLRPLLADADDEVRLRARSVLLSANGDTDLTERERFDVFIHDLARPAPPYVALRAIGRLRARGEEGRAALEAAASGTGPDAEAARRLLRSWAP